MAAVQVRGIAGHGYNSVCQALEQCRSRILHSVRETKRRTRTGDGRGVWLGVRASLGIRVDLRIWACGVSVGVAGCSETNCRAVPGRRRPASPCAMTRMSKEGGRFERRTSGHAHVTFQDNNAVQSGTRLGTATASCYSAPGRVPGDSVLWGGTYHTKHS